MTPSMSRVAVPELPKSSGEDGARKPPMPCPLTVTLPFAFPLSLLATVPMALLAYRHRLRVLVAATVASTIIAFLIIQFQPTELQVYIWNSTQNQTMDIPFALIVAC